MNEAMSMGVMFGMLLTLNIFQKSQKQRERGFTR